jgi:eukaryotic-like serine/threonine-protein kinase
MSISRGTRFGPYEIVEPIGSGGMGEVYRARDTTLGRDVALKVLPASFSNDAMRVARFEQEAKTLASLNHANIAHIYGLERSEGSTGIVMELVDGETLVDRLAQGPIPATEALRIANQIADALEAAHERAIVHRDLKPANVKIKPDGTVKVLDFGIAKALDPRFITGPGPAALTTPAVTEAGFILGTAAYMSPEQARGKFVDQRSDIWAFGCVLYEMLTGKPTFLGEDVTGTLARVLERDADMRALPSAVAPSVRRTLELCLEKDANKRLRHVADMKLALAGAFSVATPVTPPPLWRRALPGVLGAAVLALIAGVSGWALKPTSPPEPKITTRFNYELPDGVSLAPLASLAANVVDIAASGNLVAFTGSNGIYVRRMGDTQARQLPGTEGLTLSVAVSPTGREVAFGRVGTNPQSGASFVQLVRIAVDGGAPTVLGEVVSAPIGLKWGYDGTLFFSQPDGIWSVSDKGGTTHRVIEAKSGEQLAGAEMLPGGEWLLFTVLHSPATDWNQADIVVQSLKSSDRRVLRSGGFAAHYVPSGYIVYVSQNVLASAFDVRSLKLNDERIPLTQGVRTPTAKTGAAFYAIANDGTLVFIPDQTSPVPQRSLVWVDRQGRESPLPLRLDDYRSARISPDGTKAVLGVGTFLPRSEPPPRLFLYDFKTENLAQLTFPPPDSWDADPVWSRDGRRIFYRAFRPGNAGILSIPAEGGISEMVGQANLGGYPWPWSTTADGKTLLVGYGVVLNDFQLGTLELGNSGEIKPLLQLDENVDEPSLSPNGQWLVETQFPKTLEMTQSEINIRPFPDVTHQRRPLGTGRHPVFSADGSELFAFDGTQLLVASVRYDPLQIGKFVPLFHYSYAAEIYRNWDVDPTGQRFLMITLPKGQQTAPTRIEVVLHWEQELEGRFRASTR